MIQSTTDDTFVSNYKGYNETDHIKLFASRVPPKYDNGKLLNLISQQFSVIPTEVHLVESKEEGNKEEGNKEGEDEGHLGYGYVTFGNEEDRSLVLSRGTVKAGKKHTIIFRPISRTSGPTSSGDNICYLYQRFVCPHGSNCKFLHVGEGGCIVKGDGVKKCFDWVRKGKCSKGDACKFRHDSDTRGSKKKMKRTIEEEGEEQGMEGGSKKKNKISDSEKDCINWKTKGKCRKGDKCPYKHSEDVRIRALAKKVKKNNVAGVGCKVCVDEGEAPSNKESCKTVVLKGDINSDMKRSTVERILKSLGAPKHKKVKVDEGVVRITWTTKEKTEDGMVVLWNRNVRDMFGTEVRVEYDREETV